jgi:alpha-glucosidase
LSSTGKRSALGTEWWRTAVIYQIYPRSFSDANGDGVGDLQGVTSRLPELARLGVDAIWLSPFYVSPQHDGGYDVANFTDVDPLFGTLADFDHMLAAAHHHGIRVIVDIVPNHTSSEHEWFVEALAAGAGSEQRNRFVFREGAGSDGELPPNNWESVFGGPAWTRIVESDGSLGQWYLHLFDTSQPDLNWQNEWVALQFDSILRFWLDRGVDGFRVDVAHGLIKADGLPDYSSEPGPGSMGGDNKESAPFWAQDPVHEVWRRWRRLLDEYDGERVLAAEAWVSPLSELAKWVRSDEMHQAFNFAYLESQWDAKALKDVIDESLHEFASVGAPSTWVLSNHDVVRHASRLALTAENPQGHGIGPKSPGLPDRGLGLRRASAATLVMLALPGSAYLYQGEELGLPEVIDIPDDARQDPTWKRTNGERYGRDGCRVPLPWDHDAPAYGFSPSGASWLPQPDHWEGLSRDLQEDDPDSTLSLYTTALRVRREYGLATTQLQWEPDSPAGVVAFTVGDIAVYANLSDSPIPLPPGEILVASSPHDTSLQPDTAVWLTR